MESADLAVLVVSSANDQHADVVERELRGMGVNSFRTSLAEWSRHTITWSSDGTLVIAGNDDAWRVGAHTIVWWRRPGWFENPSLDAEELDLARDESAVMFPGSLEAAGVAWVDQPWVMERGSNRLIQLKLATDLGGNPPQSLVTNSPDAAAKFLESGPTVAKTISTGTGLAPYVDYVERASLQLVASAPVLLQRALAAEADWRIVIVGSTCLGWRRERQSDKHLDWRACDPSGESFVFSPFMGEASQIASAIQEGLGLTFSVQDWLEVDGQFRFLEVNPQGQWLFLTGAESTVGPAMAAHLGLSDSP